ncbi:hypothetical protein MMC07_006576 [Pseudocyphellaria aurata]|nr:hypothetical protein [Pseudocyphellaria aurata]
MEASGDPAGLLSPGLRGILQQHILPHLSVDELAHLAASCPALRRLVVSTDARTWQRAAQAAMPWHPPLPASITEVQAALNAHRTCSCNISGVGLDNTSIFCHEMQGTTWHVSPSADGQHVAYVCQAHQASMPPVWLLHHQSLQHLKLFDKPNMEPVSTAWQQNGRLQVALRWHDHVRLCSFDVSGCEPAKMTGPLAPLTQSHMLSFYWSDSSCMVLMNVDVESPSHQYILLNGDTGTSVRINKPAAWSPEQWSDRELSSVSFSGSDAAIAVIYSTPFHSQHPEHTLYFYECRSGAPLTSFGSNEHIHAQLGHGQSRTFYVWHDDPVGWWLNEDSCFLIPITSAASNKMDLGVLSLRDGSCRPLNCEFSSRHHTLAAFKDMMVSPDGQHAAITIITNKYGYELLFVDLQKTTCSQSVRINSHERSQIFGFKCWSPCSHWLAVCHDLSDSDDEVPQLQLMLVGTSNDQGKQVGIACEAAVPLTSLSVQAALNDCHRVNADYWSLRWSPTGSSVRFVGMIGIDKRSGLSSQEFMMMVKASFI